MKRCTRCIMDNSSDDTITFNENGECNYCTEAIGRMKYTYFPNEIGEKKLRELITQIKKAGVGRKYDCIMGISGGLDSSYLLMLGSKWNLRILAIHIDDGFDTTIAKENIRKLCQKTKQELIVVNPDKEQFNDLTRAYILAGVPNVAIPQDNILFACIYAYMRKHKIRYFLTGGNFALESILQKGNTHSANDLKNIQSIHKQFGTKPLNRLIFMSERKRILNRFLYKIRAVRPLNFIDYNKERAISELKAFCDFDYYEAKHLENTFTKVAQLYWFYHKFGVDKRTSHLSSLIVSGQMTREEALQEMQKPIYNKDLMTKDINDVLEKIQLPKEVFDELVETPGHNHTDYKYSKSLIFDWFRNLEIIKKIKQKL